MGVKKLIAPQGVFSFEVSYFADVCDYTLFDTIYHEHSSYHTIKPLMSFFDTHGMEVFSVEKISNHGGSIRVFVRRIEDKASGRWEGAYCCISGCRKIHDKSLHKDQTIDWWKAKDQEENIEAKVEMLKKNIKYLGLELRETLREYKEQGKSIAIYGTPAKATTLMYALGIKKEWIDFAVDDAPLKQGTFTPGSHIPIFPTNVIYEKKPDILLVLAWNFAESIIKKHSKFPGKWIVPIPELKEYQ
jgi:hypothetical protein